jgi:hypothetical protein
VDLVATARLNVRRGVACKDKLVGPSRSCVPWSRGVIAEREKRIQ